MRCLFVFLSAISLANNLTAQRVGDRPPVMATPDTSVLPLLTPSSLRNGTAAVPAGRTVFLSATGWRGIFVYDPADKTAADDSVMTLVTKDGRRYKRMVEGDRLNVQWFGALGNGSTDDWYAIQKGINYILHNNNSPRTLYFPSGDYPISKPLIIALQQGSAYRHVSIDLCGPLNSKNAAAGFAIIAPVFNNSFAIGIQSGKGVQIRDLSIIGRFTFPNNLNYIQVDTLSAAEWTDGSSRDNQFSPYAGIVIDPFSDPAVYKSPSDMYPGLHSWYLSGMGRAGSTAVQVTGCSIRNFIVGVMITPSYQQNGELIDVIDCDLSGNKVGYAMGQAQSKECHVQRVKCWLPTLTLFDNGSYGFRHGDGAAVPYVDGVNVAGAVNQLCRIYASSFGGSFRNVYAEGLFKLGFISGPATVSFEDCQIDFASLTEGVPYPDFFLLGSGVTFQNCLLRLYPGVPGARLILSGVGDRFTGGATNAPPVTVNLNNNGNYASPIFQNVGMYYSGGILGNANLGSRPPIPWSLQGSNANQTDPVYFGNCYLFRDPFYGVDVLYKMTYDQGYERTVRLSGMPVLHTDKTKWTGFFKLSAPTDSGLLRPGDLVLTAGLPYYGDFKIFISSTYPVGIIRSIGHDTVHLDNLGLGIRNGMTLPLWSDYYVNEYAPMTGDIAAGGNTLVNVQGRFPAIGERIDMPMLPNGSFVTAVDTTAKTISFSSRNMTGRSFTDYTFINGFPKVEMYSPYDLPLLQQYKKTIIGGADFYQIDAGQVNTYHQEFPLNGMQGNHFKILHTNFGGDTSLHKLLYRVISIDDGASPPVVVSSAAGTTVKIVGDDLHLQLVIKTGAAVSGEIVHIRFGNRWGSAPVSVIGNGDAFTAANASGLYCRAEGLSELVVGGKLSAGGVYIFQVQTGQ